MTTTDPNNDRPVLMRALAHDNCRYVMGPTSAVHETMEKLRELVAPGRRRHDRTC